MITSKQNKQVEYAKKLADKKGRRESGEFLIEGAKLVADAFAHGLDVTRVFVTPEHGKTYPCETLAVSEAVMKSLCDAETNQGVAATAKIPASKPYDKKSALVLDRIQDPKNLGSILRTAMGAGINTVFLLNCADAFSPKALRAGMSGQFAINLIATDAEVLKQLTAGMQIISADMGGENVFTFKAEKDFVLILGNEGGGISEELKALSAHTVSVPMKNNLESLNVAVSAGIIMYQITSNK